MSIKTEIKYVYWGVQGAFPQWAVTHAGETAEHHAIGISLKLVSIAYTNAEKKRNRFEKCNVLDTAQEHGQLQNMWKTIWCPCQGGAWSNNNNNNHQPVVGSVLQFRRTSSSGTRLLSIVNCSVPPWILGEVLALKHNSNTIFFYPSPPHLSWPMMVFPLTSNLPPFQCCMPLHTSSNCSPNRLLFIFPHCRHLPPPTSSAACACFCLSCQKSSRIHLPDSVQGWNRIHRTCTRAQQTLHPNSFNIIQLTQLASIHLQSCILLKICTLHFWLPYNGMVNPGISYPMLSPCSWQPSLNTGIQRPYIILLSTTTLPFVMPTLSAVGCPPSA